MNISNKFLKAQKLQKNLMQNLNILVDHLDGLERQHIEDEK